MGCRQVWQCPVQFGVVQAQTVFEFAVVVLDAPADLGDVIWSASSGTPAYLNAVDPTSGVPLLSAALPGSSGAYGVEQAPDGSVYAGTYGAGRLYRLAPGATEVEDLGVPVAGEAYISTTSSPTRASPP